MQESTYYPFGGEQLQITSTVPTMWLFTGMERDSESTLDHTLFRKYTSSLVRWLSPDPMAGDISNPQSLNRYAYVGNNPMNFTDPLGLYEVEPQPGAGTPIPPPFCTGDFPFCWDWGLQDIPWVYTCYGMCTGNLGSPLPTGSPNPSFNAWVEGEYKAPIYAMSLWEI